MENDKTICQVEGCGVPRYLHATCCGWNNANLIIYPQDEDEIGFQKLKLAATGQEIRITGSGAFIITGN